MNEIASPATVQEVPAVRLRAGDVILGADGIESRITCDPIVMRNDDMSAYLVIAYTERVVMNLAADAIVFVR